MISLADAHILELPQYVPGKSIKEASLEYGVQKLIKLASNENPWGPSPLALKEIEKSLCFGHLYPNTGRREVKERICHHHENFNLEPENIVLGNGANELIMLLVRAFVGQDQKVVNAWPSFIVYSLAAQTHQREEIRVPLTVQLDYDLPAMLEVIKKNSAQVKLVFIANPNNPTGRYLSKAALDNFIAELPDHVIIAVDEAYGEFVDDEDYGTIVDWIKKRPRVVVLRTFSKIFGLAGFRLGYAICEREMAEILHRVREPFNVNCAALFAAHGALDDIEHVRKTKNNNSLERVRVRAELLKMGLQVTVSSANFLLVHLSADCLKSADQVINELIYHGVIVRPVDSYEIENAFRVTIGQPQENDQFLKALTAII